MWGRTGVNENLTETRVEGGWREVPLISVFLTIVFGGFCFFNIYIAVILLCLLSSSCPLVHTFASPMSSHSSQMFFVPLCFRNGGWCFACHSTFASLFPSSAWARRREGGGGVRGVLQKDCEDETRGARQCQSETIKKEKEKKQPCHFLSKCCCYLRESISREHTAGTPFPFRRQFIHSPNKWPRKAWLFTVFPTIKAQQSKFFNLKVTALI